MNNLIPSFINVKLENLSYFFKNNFRIYCTNKWTKLTVCSLYIRIHHFFYLIFEKDQKITFMTSM